MVALTIGIVALRSMPASDRVADAKAGASPQGKLWGYDAGYIDRYWGSLKDARISERKLLLVDLAFPLLYGGAFAMAVLFAWSMLGFHPRWLLALLAAVLIGVAADWTENLVLLAQLGQFEKTGSSSAGWIRLARTATTLKWVFVGVSFIETVVLAIAVVR